MPLKETNISEITEILGHYAVQNHSIPHILVRMENHMQLPITE